MILRSIELVDFGLYAGTNEIDLIPRRRRGSESPIILIGGKNGAGKTTLLEAVRLALYGRRALGTRVAQSEYETYLRERIHRNAGVRSAAVGLEFDYAESGVIHRYRVRREWVVRGKNVVETLVLNKDGTLVTSVPREEWHYFLQELIPPGVSQLFFFDGEKIREIADGEEENEQLADAVRGLLGIELVGRLRTDLGLYLARHNRNDEGSAKNKLESVLRDHAQLERRAIALAEEIAELNSVRESQARAAEQIRRRFIAEGGDAAAQRGRLEGEREEVLRSIARCEHELRELANGLLPFTVAPRLVASFQRGLRAANADKGTRSEAKALQKALATWKKSKSASPERRATWSAKHWTDLERFLDTWSKGPKEIARTSPAFREVGDGKAALTRLTEVEVAVRPKARKILDELDTLGRRAAKLDAALARADNAAAGILLDELRLAEQRVGSTEATLQSKQAELKEVRGQQVTLDRERRRLLDEQAGAAAAADRADLAARAAQALLEYEYKLLDHKLAQLRGEFVRRFNQLARKTNLVSDVKIDPKTFATTLVDGQGRELPKSALSAGEKQVYAIAMLWALAKTSGRPLPMIIDTPLARLDSEHRGSLIERYFPTASHQVILLSTDTEVDETLVAALGDSISHAYRLDYDQDAACTVVSPGYFGRSTNRPEEDRRALQQA
ncbi:DNA sulfur modification protein DndD [Hyphomicrobium sp. DY-1]|uniref:DNA sulfur modification protein DndD n=1 Tax=Hyphomicrobium sp. DY-1 TaxID=3075650 RepID=UPI0039C27347